MEIGTGSRDVNENVGQHQYAACVNVIPSFWIKRELENGRAAYLRNTYVSQDGSWKPNALIGFYLTRKCDNLDEFACVTTENCKSLFSKSFGQLFVNSDQSAWEYNKNVAIFGGRGHALDELLRNGICWDLGNLYFHL